MFDSFDTVVCSFLLGGVHFIMSQLNRSQRNQAIPPVFGLGACVKSGTNAGESVADAGAPSTGASVSDEDSLGTGVAVSDGAGVTCTKQACMAVFYVETTTVLPAGI